MVTKELYQKYRTAREFAAANQTQLEREIRSTGFYRMKAKSIIACSKALVERYEGEVPRDMEALVQLPGVGRKTANVVLGQAFGIASGVVVDTHVHRLAQRMGLSAATTPEKIEADLTALFPRKHWVDVGSVLILHGRATCSARKPKCADCVIGDLCPSAHSFLQQTN
jgi:endonuclease-3